MARIEDKECQDFVRQSLCAYTFNARGQCLPPYTLEPSPSNTPLEELTYNRYSYPERGIRPSLEPLAVLQRHSLAHLVPVRLGFVIMAHTGAAAVLQLLELIYRPQHFYVIHLDQRSKSVREELKRALGRRFVTGANVRLLPEDRSFQVSSSITSTLRSADRPWFELSSVLSSHQTHFCRMQ